MAKRRKILNSERKEEENFDLAKSDFLDVMHEHIYIYIYNIYNCNCQFTVKASTRKAQGSGLYET